MTIRREISCSDKHMKFLLIKTSDIIVCINVTVLVDFCFFPKFVPLCNAVIALCLLCLNRENFLEERRRVLLPPL